MANVIDYLKRHLLKDVGKYSPQSFTPKNDVNLDDYKTSLDDVFNKDNKNIAFFGADGVGKSSVIETYKKKHNGIRFLHITLAYHKSTAESEKDDREIKESVLEGIIINQLIHQINPQKIPLTKFKVKKEQNRYSTIATVLLTMVFLLSILHITKFTDWQGFVDNLSSDWIIPIKQLLLFTASNEAPLFSGIICFAVLFIIMLKLSMDSQYRITVKKVSLQGNEIELFLESEAPYFNKYLNDVVYLFEKTDADVIVFEDISGYITKQIFQNLLNINKLVNDRRNTPLRFLYLLPDDMLDSNSKRKFFDYTFSFIGYDIYEEFIKLLKREGIYKFFIGDEEFLKEVSSYIKDMRLLIDVCNGFSRYPKLYNQQKRFYKKLFTVMIYKNHFQKDYENLQHDKGFVYTLFSRKGELVQNIISSLDIKIGDLTCKKDDTKTDPLESVLEIDIVYDYKIEHCKGIVGSREHSDEIKRLQDERESRKERIKNQKKRTITALNKNIRFIKEQKERIHNELYNANLSKILTSKNVDKNIIDDFLRRIIEETDFNINERSQYDLLQYFLQNGHIDETYKEYMYC